MPTPITPNSPTGWRARQPPALLAADATADAVPTHWEAVLNAETAECRLPAPVLDRLIHEAVTDALPEIAALLNRKLRYLIRHEERARLQSCDSY